jgi:cell wall-associated NlpC family hydrolase
MNAQEIFTYVEGLEKENAALKSAPKATPEWEVKADTVIAIAKALNDLGIPYVFGGESIKGMDCSGFVQFIYKQIGISLPRVSRNQAKEGTQIDKKNDKLWRKGDLITFDYSDNGVVDHIGIYMGNGYMIHTNTPSTDINVKAVSDKTGDIATVNRVIK